MVKSKRGGGGKKKRRSREIGLPEVNGGGRDRGGVVKEREDRGRALLGEKGRRSHKKGQGAYTSFRG